MAARLLRTGRILRVNPPGRAAGGAGGTGATRAGPAANLEQILASLGRLMRSQAAPT